MSGTAPGTATALLPQKAAPVSGTALLPPIEGEQCRAGTASLWGQGGAVPLAPPTRPLAAPGGLDGASVLARPEL
jgi:hypothetical protein